MHACCALNTEAARGIGIRPSRGDSILACLKQVTRSAMKGSQLSSSAKRIQKELAEISLDPPCNCSAGPKGDNIYEWVSTIVGPSGARSQIWRSGNWRGRGRSLSTACRTTHKSCNLQLRRLAILWGCLLPRHHLPARLPLQATQGTHSHPLAPLLPTSPWEC